MKDNLPNMIYNCYGSGVDDQVGAQGEEEGCLLPLELCKPSYLLEQ
jgi:hypothetical protein